MKKTRGLALVLVLLTSLFVLSACSSGSAQSEDLDYVQKNGKLVIGVIEAEPLTYEEDGEWAGFTVDLLEAFTEQIGVDAEFVEIDWSEKEQLLDDKEIDCVASALTLTDARREAMECSDGYLNNQQIVVTKVNVARGYTSAEDCLRLSFAVLDGSTHETLARENGFRTFTTQTTDEALQAVADGTVDATIINSVLANTMIGEGNKYPDLARAFPMTNVQFGFGFRKDSDLAQEMNDFLLTTYTSGVMKEMAEPYSLEYALVEQVTEK